MKTEIINNSLMILPETEFEKQWLQSYKISHVFHKNGLTPADYIGIKLVREGNEAS